MVRPKPIVMTGLLGTGKSSIAESVGQALGVPVFAKVWLEGGTAPRWASADA